MLHSETNEKFEMHNIFKIFIFIFGLFVLYHVYVTPKPTPIIVQVKDPKFSLLGPYNTSGFEVDDNYDQLIDLKNFTFKINPQSCQNSSSILLVVIISSNPNNSVNRDVIRRTWGHSSDTTKVLFLIGETSNTKLSESIEKESETFNDIIQGNFIDAYRNMTYKHVMGLKWVSHHCPMAKYVLKTDDDVAVNSFGLRQFLARELSPWGANGLIMCQVFVNAEVQRGNSKWTVSEAEYSGKNYPTYCAGWAIMYSQDVVQRLLTMAQNIPYFWIDDVHVTGVVAQKIGVSHTSLAGLLLSKRQVNMLIAKPSAYTGRFLFGPPDLKTETITQIWQALTQRSA